jgi:glutamate racemase
MGHDVTLVSSADETAFAARAVLGQLGLLRSPTAVAPGTHRFLSSGDIATFRDLGSRLLGPELNHTEAWVPPSV